MSGRGAEWRARARSLAASGACVSEAASEMGMSCAAFGKAVCREFGCTWIGLKRSEATSARDVGPHGDVSEKGLVAIAEERTARFLMRRHRGD